MPDLYKRPLLITAALILVCLPPLLLANVELWDSVYAEIAIRQNDLESLRWMTEKGWYLAYYLYVVFDWLARLTGIPYKVFTNVITVASVLGIARETFWFARNRFGLEREYALIAGWAILTFPIWHILISTGVFINIVCIWLFMAGLRYWYSNKLIALPLLVLSMQLYSLFALGVGVAVAEFLLTVSRETLVKKSLRTMVLGLILLLGFLGLTSIINVHGRTGTYNTISLDGLEYFYILLGYCAAFLAGGLLMQWRMTDREEAVLFMRRVAAITVLLFFAILPYVAVGRPMRYFAFGSFTARHAMLNCLPFALFLAVVFRYLALKFGAKTARWTCTLLFIGLVVLLHQGYSHKAAALVFKDMLTAEFRQTPPPPSGYVAIKADGYEAPRHVHNYAINMCLFKAYGRMAWMANGFYKRGMSKSPESLKKLYVNAANKPYLKDVTGNAYTKYVFSLDGFHQEGRFWYWWYYLTSDYSAFHPRLEKVASLPGSD